MNERFEGADDVITEQLGKHQIRCVSVSRPSLYQQQPFLQSHVTYCSPVSYMHKLRYIVAFKLAFCFVPFHFHPVVSLSQRSDVEYRTYN